METVAYYDGTIGTTDEVMIPFNDRSHFFGDGVYEATAGANGVAFLLDEHLDRFYSSAKAVEITVPMERAELATLLTDLLSRADAPVNMVYWQVTRGAALRDHTFPETMQGKLWVLIKPMSLDYVGRPAKLVSTEDKRFLYGNIKMLNLLPAVMYAQMAHRAGADETVLHRNGVVTECAHSNISILKNGVLYSHPNDEHILRGIAKTHLIQACYRLGITVLEKPFTLEQLKDADEAIVTSSAKLCMPVAELDGVALGGKDPERFSALGDEITREFLACTGAKSLS